MNSLLTIPRSSHSRFPGRLTRDYKADQVAISGKIAIFDFPENLVKKAGKIQKIGFLDSWDQNKILKFLDFSIFFIYGQYFLYKPLFPSS